MTPVAQLRLIDARSVIAIHHIRQRLQQRSHHGPGIAETNWRWSRWLDLRPPCWESLANLVTHSELAGKYASTKDCCSPSVSCLRSQTLTCKAAINIKNPLTFWLFQGRCREQSSFGQSTRDPVQQCSCAAQDVPLKPTCVCLSQTASPVSRSGSAAWRHQHRENPTISNHGDLTGSASTESITVGD